MGLQTLQQFSRNSYHEIAELPQSAVGWELPGRPGQDDLDLGKQLPGFNSTQSHVA